MTPVADPVDFFRPISHQQKDETKKSNRKNKRQQNGQSIGITKNGEGDRRCKRILFKNIKYLSVD